MHFCATSAYPPDRLEATCISRADTKSYGAPAVPVVDAGAVSRLAVIGDVHRNAVAFAAVLEEIRADPPELVVMNGDGP